MTETLFLTNSEMKDWRRCKRKWWLSNYRGLQKKGSEEYNQPLSIGTRVHDTLAHYYIPGMERPDWEVFFWATVEVDVETHPEFEKDIRKEADLCHAMLEGYFQWLEEEGEDMELEVIEAESEMSVPLVIDDKEVKVALLSKIDTRVRRVTDDKIGAIEHKTVQSLTDPIRRLQTDTQLLTEHLVEYMDSLEREPGTAEDNRAQFVLYNMLRKVKRTGNAKPPFYGRHEVQHSIIELRNHWKHCYAIAEEILEMRKVLDEGEYDPHIVAHPNPTKECTWDCPFREPCLGGMFDDGSDVEGYLADQFEAGDPLERYRRASGLTVNHTTAAVESAS